jgi:hypothetical protein
LRSDKKSILATSKDTYATPQEAAATIAHVRDLAPFARQVNPSMPVAKKTAPRAAETGGKRKK